MLLLLELKELVDEADPCLEPTLDKVDLIVDRMGLGSIALELADLGFPLNHYLTPYAQLYACET